MPVLVHDTKNEARELPANKLPAPNPVFFRNSLRIIYEKFNRPFFCI
jgi:hypothetical protein